MLPRQVVVPSQCHSCLADSVPPGAFLQAIMLSLTGGHIVLVYRI